MAGLGLRCCARAFSSCGEQGLLFVAVRGLLTAGASHCSGFSCCGARALGAWASVVVACALQQLWLAGSRVQAQQLWPTGLVAPRHVGSSQTRARTCVPCIGRRILNHCATREVLKTVIFLKNYVLSICIHSAMAINYAQQFLN